MYKKPKTLGVLLFVVIFVLGLSITASAEDDFPPSVEPTVVRSADNPLPLTSPLTLLGEQIDITSDLVTPKVIGGTAVSPENKYPWMVSQQFFGGNFCGGTLIAPEWVLTAAHCWTADTDQPPYYAVIIPTDEVMVLGEYDITTLSDHEQFILPAEVYVHPLFDPSYLKYDVALIKLETPAVLDEYVSTVSLADGAYTNTVLSTFDGTVAGWGVYDDYNTGTPSDILLEANVDFLADSICTTAYGASYDPTNMICAGVYPEGTRDTCSGDSGGPLFFSENGVWKQAGITSFGNECALPDFPGVYSRVSASLDWIGTYVDFPEKVALYDEPLARFYRKSGLTTSSPEAFYTFGAKDAGWMAISGDWDGNGTVTFGLYNPVKAGFYLKNTHIPGFPDLTYTFGARDAGWIPIAGDWDGDGVDTLGLYNPVKAAFYLKNTHVPGFPDLMYTFGAKNAGWIPIAGDWDGDGIDTLGLYNPVKAAFYLKNTHVPGFPDLTYTFGAKNAGWLPFAGDWDGDGVDTLGLYDPSRGLVFLKNTHIPGPPQFTFYFTDVINPSDSMPITH